MKQHKFDSVLRVPKDEVHLVSSTDIKVFMQDFIVADFDPGADDGRQSTAPTPKSNDGSIEGNARRNVKELRQPGQQLGSRYRCNLCDKVYGKKCRLTRHLLVHGESRPFQCDVCSRGFLEKAHLLVHRRIHTEEKPYECAFCRWSFAHKSHVKEHERIHNGERPYRCDYCDKGFKRQAHKRNHEKTVHKISIRL